MKTTIATLSEANQNQRLDSQFFHPEYVHSFNNIIGSPHNLLEKTAHVTDGNHMKIAEEFDDKNGIRYLRGQDLSTKMMLQDRNNVYIPETLFNALKRSHIYKDDILITIVGANTGLVGLVYDPPKKLVANCKLGIVRVNKKTILSGYLYAFLTSKYGQHQILRSIRGGGQTGLILPDMRQLKITRLSESFERTIHDLVYKGHEKNTESKAVYSQCETLLLAELGLANWKPKHRLSFVKNASEVEKAGRVDAEYFQPKYEEIEGAIKAYTGGYSFIKSEFKQNKSTLKIEENKIYQYVEIGSVNVSSGEIEPKDVLGKELPANAKRVLKKGDVIVSKVRTYRGAITIVEESGYVGSGAFTILQAKGRINKETLYAFLHSKPLLAWSLKPNTGTSYPTITDADILNIPIPLFPDTLQSKIQAKVNEAIALRTKSKELLESAKRAVEMAIEKSEEKSLSWLEHQTKDYEESKYAN